MKEYDIKAMELSIDIGDLNFLCAFGTHINGGWTAIINWGIAAELSSFGDIDYNTDRLYAALANTNMHDTTKIKIAKGLSEVISPLIKQM